MERYICQCGGTVERGVAHTCPPSQAQQTHNYAGTRLEDVCFPGNPPATPSFKTIVAPTMNVATTGGLRDNKGKPRLSLVPSELEAAVAEVIWKSSDRAGGKYPLQNWRKGLPWSEVAESALRHIKKFAQEGEDLDHETGLSHLSHAACNIAFLLWYQKHRPNLDDRHKEEK